VSTLAGRRDLLLFLAGAGVAGARYWAASPVSVFAQVETFAVARSLVETGRFADPFQTMPTGATAHVAPLFPAFLALLIIAFREFSPHATVALTCCAHGLFTMLLPKLSRVVFGREGPGIAAAVMSAVLPYAKIQPTWEGIWAAVASMAWCVWVGGGGAGAIGAGVGMGLVALLHPGTAVLCAVWLLTRARREAAVTLAVAAAVCAPWIARNYAAFGMVVPVRDNFGLEFFLSNRPESAVSVEGNFANGVYARWHPDSNRVEAERVRAMGEGAYNRMRLGEGLAEVAAAPLRFVELSARRAGQFWFPERGIEWRIPYALWAASVLCFTGVWLIRRDGVGVAWAVWMLLLFPLPHYLVNVDPRYRTPAAWVIEICAGYAVWRILSKSGGLRGG
jgi:hypothetical protein